MTTSIVDFLELPVPVIEYVAPAPDVTHTEPNRVIERTTPPPVIQYIAPSPAISYPSVQEILEVQVLERIQEQTEEQIVHVSAPPIVDNPAEAAPIIPGSPLPQTMEESSDILRLQKLLLSSVAAMGRIQATAPSLDQRITEHERSAQENRLLEQIADQIQDAPTKKRRKGRHKNVNYVVWYGMIQEMKFVWAPMIPHLLLVGRGGRTQPWFGATLVPVVLAAYAATAGYTARNDVPEFVSRWLCLVRRQLKTSWDDTGGIWSPREMTVEALFR